MSHDGSKRETGIEPVTIRAAIERSTTELPARRALPATSPYHKHPLHAIHCFHDRMYLTPEQLRLQRTPQVFRSYLADARAE